MAKIGVAIVGGTGYGAGELLRLLTRHEHCEVVSVVSSSMPWRPVVEAHPHLRSLVNVPFSDAIDYEQLESSDHAILFSALPHGTSCAQIKEIIKAAPKKLKVIDLSGDFRLSDANRHAEFYPDSETDPELRKEFEYGLPELFTTRWSKVDYVANPGCMVTAAALAVGPIFHSSASFHKLDGALVCDVKTGISGAGKTPTAKTHLPERHGNISAYSVLEHRHEPELQQALGDPKGEKISTSFVPHLIPISRGLFVTMHFTVDKEMTKESLQLLYEQFYREARFVRIVEGTPDLQAVIGTNFCDIAVNARGRQVVAMAAVDNLCKGMAGQAIQTMNLLYGLPEETGLWEPALGLV